MPSTSINGLASFKVPTPRICTLAPSELGLAVVCITFKPAAIPERADDIVVTGRDMVSSAKLIVATDPVRFTFFWDPYPTTTKASESSFIAIDKFLLLPILMS